jgi:hypothetical protein
MYSSNWKDINESSFDSNCNGIALLTGKINDIFVIDIDNIEHWNKFLKVHNETEPETVKAKSGSGGIHLYFKYTENLKEIKTKSHCFGSDYDIDVRTNGGNIIVPPSKYNNKKYEWINSLLDYDPIELPNWILKLLEPKELKRELKKKNKQEINNEINEIEETIKNKNIKLTKQEIKNILNILDKKRYNDYKNWLDVGMCLYNTNTEYIDLWDDWSSQSIKYDEDTCHKKWESFKEMSNGLSIGTLLYYAKQDNENEYKKIMDNNKISEIIKQNFPKENLQIDKIANINENNCMVSLKNKKCIIAGKQHDMKNSMYINISKLHMYIACHHPECFGKQYPCNHIQLTKNEMNIMNVINGNVINNYYGTNEELVEFQKLKLFETEELNELVYNSLYGEHEPFAEIGYYYYKNEYNNEYNYGEDENWYEYNNKTKS